MPEWAECPAAWAVWEWECNSISDFGFPILDCFKLAKRLRSNLNEAFFKLLYDYQNQQYQIIDLSNDLIDTSV